MEINRIENYCKEKKTQKKAKEDINIVHNMDKNMKVYTHIAFMC